MNDYLIALLRAALHEKRPENPPENMDWLRLFQLAKSHSVACTAYFALEQLKKSQRPPEQIMQRFQKEMYLVRGRETMQHLEIQAVLEAFEQNKISCVPLKGWNMKLLYPRIEMRSMCDVDILIRGKDLKRAAEILLSLDFERELHGSNHDSFIKSEIVSTEIHWDLFPEKSPYYDYFHNIMDRTVPEEGRQYVSTMSKEDFYLHLLGHMAKHFQAGGPGIRSVMDIWIYQNTYRGTLDENYLREELKKSGLTTFASVIEELAGAWFDEGRTPEERQAQELVGRFIQSNGTYGTKSGEVLSHLRNMKKSQYLWKRFFPGVSFLKYQFPLLEKAPVLLPVFWVIRGIRSVFFRRKKFMMEMQAMSEAGDNQLHVMNQIYEICQLPQGKD